jgi:hypothetical protein
MAQKKHSVTTKEKMAVAQAIAKDARAKHLAEVAKSNLTLSPTEQWRVISTTDKEIVIARCFGGETVTQICEDLGIDKGLIYTNAYYDHEFAERLAVARQMGQHALVDYLLDLPRDRSMTIAERELMYKSITFHATRIAKTSKNPLGNYNERVEVHERQETINITLPASMKDIKI